MQYGFFIIFSGEIQEIQKADAGIKMEYSLLSGSSACTAYRLPYQLNNHNLEGATIGNI
ncbi:hypothetical protein OKW21_005392 [Catalinimonas alkaloidigena]|uniref:hypothetical protein n=1 Tax=Catalinimonas alkaloidigena TaxID=1075417 RepID=UPI002406852D|nr:hypothetical protein [Catalinimonas alkaloidigena]MDF9800129.1 hypothetical protein [Catalinimonas alkaloidigena]